MIAGLMAELVVDHFEIIEIEDSENIILLCRAQRARCFLKERPAVGDAGQRIGLGFDAMLFRGAFLDENNGRDCRHDDIEERLQHEGLPPACHQQTIRNGRGV